MASWDEEARLGLFTRFLLEGLQGAADNSRFGQRDGRATLQEAKGCLDRKMTYTAQCSYGRKRNATAQVKMQEALVRLPQ